MHSNSILRGWTLATVLAVPALTLTLAAQQASSLVVNGQQGAAQVIQVQGRNYVEVEGLARLVNGSISFNGSQIVLTLPGSGGDTSPDTASPPAAGFSKEFMNAGIEAMAEVREWHTALKTTIEHGLPITADWLNSYGAQAQQALRVASVAVNTDADKSAFALLQNEFNRMKKLNDKYVQMSVSMNYIAPTSLQSDPLDQKIIACARSLSAMATAKQFIDDGSCR
jgi:hypothetical protein